MTLSKFFDVLDLVLTSATCFCLNQLKLFVFLFQKMKPNLRGSIKKFTPLCQKSYWFLYFLFKLFLPLHYRPCYHLIQLFFVLLIDFVLVFVADIRGRFVSVRSVNVTWAGSLRPQIGNFIHKNSGDSPGIHSIKHDSLVNILRHKNDQKTDSHITFKILDTKRWQQF